MYRFVGRNRNLVDPKKWTLQRLRLGLAHLDRHHCRSIAIGDNLNPARELASNVEKHTQSLSIVQCLRRQLHAEHTGRPTLPIACKRFRLAQSSPPRTARKY